MDGFSGGFGAADGYAATEGKDLITFHKSVVLTGAELGNGRAAYFRKDGTLLEG